MSDFFADNFAMTTSYAKLIDVGEEDRMITLITVPAVGFTLGFDDTAGAHFTANAHAGLSFILPDDHELWGAVDSGTASISLIISRG